MEKIRKIEDMPNNYENIKILDGYNIETLKALYKSGIPIKESGEEQYKNYMENSNQNYWNFKVLSNYRVAKGLMISNYGNIKLNSTVLYSSPVKNGHHFGLGKYDTYDEILIPEIYTPKHIFLPYRLVAEVWCNNPNIEIYTCVHHIGNDNYNNSKNLIFLTENQHDLIHSDYNKKY
jgi:hypothetical protein